MTPASSWRCLDTVLPLDGPLVMGIVNVTDDSFSDGGECVSAGEAVRKALRLAREGADIIDIGGESTRPGSVPVPESQELERVVPVVEALAREGLVVSVDTSRPEVMRASLEAGAKILNDVRSFRAGGAAELAAASGAGLVIMHMKGRPADMQEHPVEGDVVSEVLSFLRERDGVLTALGARPDAICWDPGFGFGKTDLQNFRLLACLRELTLSGRPVLMGLSRKSSIGRATGVADPRGRLAGSVAGALLAAVNGAGVVRVHDVAATCEALAVLRRMRAAAELDR